MILSLVLSFCYELSDEPHLDGQDKDAAGEEVCTLLNFPALCVFSFFLPLQSIVASVRHV